MHLAAAPPVRPADDGVFLPAQLHDHQVPHVHVGGEEEGDGGVAVEDRPAGEGGEEAEGQVGAFLAAR